MDVQRAHDTIYELVEAAEQERTVSDRLDNFHASEQPPRAPSEFANMEEFLSFYSSKRRYETELQELESTLNRLKDVYARAARALEDILPENTPLHFTYNGKYEDLKDTKFLIVNRRVGPNQRQITISITGRG